MIGAVHPGKGGHGHVAGDALVRRAIRLVVGVGRRIFHLFLVARHAGIVGLFFSLEPVTSAGGVARHTVDLSCLGAWAHEPGGIRVVLTQVTAIRVEVRVLQGGEIVVVEEALPRRVRGGYRGHLGVTAGTGGVVLLGGEFLDTDDLHVLRLLPLGSLFHDPVVLCRWCVTGFAVDTRFCPGCFIRIGLEVVVV